MNPGANLVMYCLTALILMAPLVFWAALRLAVSIGYSVSAETLYLVRILRWSVGIAAAVLVVLYFAGVLRLDAWPLAAALGACSVGLSRPQGWVKTRIAKEVSVHP